MKQICERNDRIVLGTEGLSAKAPRITARAVVRNQDGLYAVMYAEKWKLHSLPGGGVEDGEEVLTALRREVCEETGCVCDEIRELGIVIYAPYRGRGYAVPALKRMLDHAFRVCGISRIHNDFEVARKEIAARETHRRAGFRELGVEDGFLQMMITREDYLKCP